MPKSIPLYYRAVNGTAAFCAKAPLHLYWDVGVLDTGKDMMIWRDETDCLTSTVVTGTTYNAIMNPDVYFQIKSH